jgi:hypothetical protein
MYSVRFRKLPKQFISKTLVALFLIILLTACGTNPGSAPVRSQLSSTTKVATKVPASNSLNLNAANLNVQQGDLLIQSSGGFKCPYASGGPATVPGQLVFVSNPTTYSQAEIAQIRAYLNSNFLTSSPPPTLRWVLGGSMDRIPGTPGGSSTCGVAIMLTNTGNTPIQIPKVGVQLKASPQQNAYQYHLLNVCSLLPPSQTGAGSCPPLGGGGPDCNQYHASIQLGLGEKNTVFSAVPSAFDSMNADCGTLTVAPAAQVKLNIDFSFAPNTPTNLIYSIMPVFTVDTNQGGQTLALSQLESTLAFAGASQFSCYGLQGTTFALITSPFSAPTWCL